MYVATRISFANDHIRRVANIAIVANLSSASPQRVLKNPKGFRSRSLHRYFFHVVTDKLVLSVRLQSASFGCSCLLVLSCLLLGVSAAGVCGEKSESRLTDRLIGHRSDCSGTPRNIEI